MSHTCLSSDPAPPPTRVALQATRMTTTPCRMCAWWRWGARWGTSSPSSSSRPCVNSLRVSVRRTAAATPRRCVRGACPRDCAVAGHDNFVLVHVSLVPEVGVVGEQKTKPTQHSVKELRSLGLSPDILICRAARELTRGTKEKLGVFCQVPADAVFSVHDVPNIFHVPLILHDQHCAEQIARRLNLRLPTPPSVALFKVRAPARLCAVCVGIAPRAAPPPPTRSIWQLVWTA